MKFSKQSLTILMVVFVLVFFGFIGSYFWQDLTSLVGLGGASLETTKNLNGQSITFTADAKSVTIPPVYSEEILSYLKKELNEKGGLPYPPIKKGNFLPFGIP